MTDETTDQAVEQSVEQRIASKFGFPAAAPTEEPPQEAQEGEAQPESDLAELEWDGQRVQVPKALKDAFMRNEDYTRKTQELAESRRAVEHIQQVAQQSQLDQAFQASVAPEQHRMALIDAYLSEAAKVDVSQMSMEQMFRHKVELDSVKEQRQALKESIAEKRSKFEAEIKSKIGELRKNAWDMAVKKIGKSGEEAQKAVSEYALSKGLSAAELENVLLDPRSAEILWEAAQYRAIKAGTQTAAERATKAPPALKPGAASERMPQNVADKLNFRKAIGKATTSAQKANVIEDRLARVFGGK